MNKPGTKIDALNSSLTLVANNILTKHNKAPGYLIISGVFLLLLSSCVMSRGEGDALTKQMRNMEDEVAKLQRVRHDVEVLLSGQMRDLFDRLARIESQLSTMRESLYEGSSKNSELVSELANLRGQLEEAQFQYRNLENDQKNLAQKQHALKQAQNIAIPPLPKEHLELAKKLHAAQKYDQAIYVFEEYIKNYENDKENTNYAYFNLGEIYRHLGENNKTLEEREKIYKKSIISYQKIAEQGKSNLKEEALFKMALVFKSMGNKQAATAALNELLNYNKNSKRAAEAKKLLASVIAE